MAELSEASTASQRTEQMQYFQAELGMDAATAALMYRAERLQEKGQLRQALCYFKEVLRSKPDCTEAQVNCRMLDEQLQQQPRLQGVPEQANMEGAAFASCCDMDSFWGWTVLFGTGPCNLDWSIEPKDLVLKAALQDVQSAGIKHPVLAVSKCETLYSRRVSLEAFDFDDQEYGWGKVQVSCIGQIFTYSMEVPWAWPFLSPGVKLKQDDNPNPHEVAIRTAWAHLRSLGMALLSMVSLDVSNKEKGKYGEIVSMRGRACVRVGHAPGDVQNKAVELAALEPASEPSR